MAVTDLETPVTIFANPFMRCSQCGRRAVGMVGLARIVVNLLTGVSQEVNLPPDNINWPCYHQAARTSVCDGWTSQDGCPHSMEERAQHSNSFTFEGVRK